MFKENRRWVRYKRLKNKVVIRGFFLEIVEKLNFFWVKWVYYIDMKFYNCWDYFLFLDVIWV